MNDEPDVDVLVVGSGIAGLCAAIVAAQTGARVLIAEAGSVVGGSSRLSGGVVMGAGTRQQQAAGIDDTPEAYFRDVMNVNQWALAPAPLWRYAQQAAPTIDWLIDLGAEFHSELVFGGTESVARCLESTSAGAGIINALHRTARHEGVDIALGQRIDRLLTIDGTVVGAAVGDAEIRAAGVVLATGGFGANREMLQRYFPHATAAGDWLWYIGAEHAQGDGLMLGQSVGAHIVGENRGLRLIHPHFVNSVESYLPGWLVLVDGEGRRFVDESAPYGILDRRMSAVGHRAFVILDASAADPEVARASKNYRQVYPARQDRTVNWNPAMVREQVEAGRIRQAASVEELAVQLGMDPQVLGGTVARYNAGAESGVDDMMKPREFVRPLTRAPFYAAEVRAATVCWTGTGLQIDEDARVLDGNGKPIAGLYAAGETTGGILGDVYVGSGGSLTNGAVFGRIAGAEAARFALTTTASLPR